MKTQIDPGYGYRLLEIGEVLQQSDEFKSPYRKTWLPLPDKWEAIGDLRLSSVHFPHRRKIDVGAGYELLPMSATLQAGDQVYSDAGHSSLDWRESQWHLSKPGITCRQIVDIWKGSSDPVLAIRRPVETAIDPGAGWRLLVEGEAIEKGDQWWTDAAWIPPVAPIYGSKWNPTNWEPYRRQVKPEAREHFIICEQLDGITLAMYKAAQNPYVHTTEADAKREAHRLSNHLERGGKFVVFKAIYAVERPPQPLRPPAIETAI